MASLVRSLLALAVVALMQLACAQHHDDEGRYLKCTEAMFGKGFHYSLHYTLPTIHIHEANSEVKIDDPESDHPGVRVTGEKITVCNLGLGPKPSVSLVSPDDLDLVKVELGFCVPRPINVEMFVTRFYMVAGTTSL